MPNTPNHFRHKLSEFVYLRTYARWLDEEKRRETWPETVTRYVDFMREQLGKALTTKEYQQVAAAILNMDVMPSMRLLQFAGKAVRASHVSAYNCAFIAPTSLRDFGEIMYITMCGTGVGFSVEKHVVDQLPLIQAQSGKKLPIHTIIDSREGWSDALVKGLNTWFAGDDIAFDFSLLRPRGARLHTTGGRSSGPAPLQDLLTYTRELILSLPNRRLNTLQTHDLICKIGEVVLAGGVRRSAMISLSDVDDADMRNAKQGTFFVRHPERSIANNAAVYTQTPNTKTLLTEWLALVESGSGERGLFNRSDLIHALPERRIELLTRQNKIKNNQFTMTMGTNPCGEIILQSKQFCNLTEVIARANDTEASLLNKIKIASLLGTYQATLTDFPYLSKTWQQNCVDERLLGVSITGQWDCKVLRNAKVLGRLQKTAIASNQRYAKRFGIHPATAVTCVKPSGTVSQVTNSASGMHPRHAPYYVRRIRIASTDPLFQLLKKQGVPYHPEVGQTEASANTFVLEFPVASPKGAVCKNDLTAIEQLEYWRMVKQHYTEHNPSVTIYVGESEWIAVLYWIQQHWKLLGGLAFLPRQTHVYQLAPYEAISQKQFEKLKMIYQTMDFSELTRYEQDDETSIRESAACGGDLCDT